MFDARRVAALAAVALLGFAGSTTAADSAKHKLKGTGLHVLNIPGLPDTDCSVAGSTSGAPLCDSVTFDVLAVEIPNTLNPGGPNLCIAYFAYNQLAIHVAKGRKPAKVTWVVGKDLQFIGDGITIIPPRGFKVSDIVDNQKPGFVQIKAKAVTNIAFGHQPRVSKLIDGQQRECGPADPVIIVNAD